MTVGTLMDTMTQDEFNGWVAYFNVKKDLRR